ncbi:MAG: MG2 domain-containing protein, partial [Myxococcota bacterium]|nr:MG2 domain-containing protein [Myxococcota bacterium]
LRFINPYTLEFRFANAPPLQKKIKVSLRALDSRWGLLEGGDSAPNAELTTPGLSFLSSRIEWSHKQARLFIKTSAAVKTDDLRSKLRISGDGIELNGWKLIGAKGHSMAIELPRLAGLAGALSIEIAEGVRAAEGNFTAAAYAQIHTRFSGKTLLIERAAALASAGGFGIDVVCHDAESGKRSWFWHREMSRSFRVGPRCEPVAGSENKISIEPAVPFRLAPGQGGFRLLGDFSRGNYRLRLAAGMRSMDGSVLLEDYDVLIKVPARPALLQFVETGRYLPRKGWKSLRFSHRNVGAIMLEVRQVRPDNLAHWLAQDDEKAGRAVGDLVIRRALRVAGEADKISAGSLNVAELIGEQFAGLLEVSLSAPGLATQSRLLVSDINLLAKKQMKTPAKDKRSAEYGFSVWALDMHSQIGLSGVKLELIAPSGRVISSCESAGDGGCELLGPKADDLDRSEPLAIIARRGKDLTYLRFSDLQIPLNQTKVGGAPYRESKPYRAFLYGDRDLYRPGEPVHVVGLLRSAADQAPKSAMPVQVEVLDARRRRIVKRVLKTDDAGLISLDFQLSEIAATGRYTINLSVADKKLATRSIRVEEFMPERMRAEVSMERKVYTSEQDLSATISAKYLFGGSAKGSPVRVDCRFSAVAPKHDGFSEFSFAPWADGKGGASGSDHRAAAKLDVSGRTEHACKRLTTAGFQPLKLRLEASVLEAGSGRSTRAWAEAVVLPDNFQIGVRSRDEKLQLGQQARFEVVVLGPDSKEMKLQEKLTLTLFRVDEKYSWGFNAAEDRWTYDHRIRLVEEKSLEHAAGKSRYEASFEVSSDAPRFLIRAQAGKARAGKIVQGVGPRYWWSDNERNADHTPQAERPV